LEKSRKRVSPRKGRCGVRMEKKKVEGDWLVHYFFTNREIEVEKKEVK
jgi:hypothetical protein